MVKELFLNLYRMMLRIRLCEESFIEPILKGEIICPVHLYSGQEAIATGVCAALKGEMSLVGPRPEVPLYVNMMTEEEKKIILSVRSGITDLASLWNFRESEILKGSPDPEKTYMEKIRPEKIRLQIEYVKNRSFWLDLKIIFKTIFKIFS